MTDRQDATRTRLLDATLGVLVSHGASRATSRQIASAAGTNLQAITYHFGSKDELVAQALVDAVRRWVEPARRALAGVGQDPVGHLFAAVAALQGALDEARGYFPAYVEALAAAPRQEAVRSEIVGLLHELRDGLAASIRELREARLVAAWVDPDAMAGLVVAAGDGFVLHSTLDPEGYAVDRTLGQVVQLLLAARTSPGVAVADLPAHRGPDSGVARDALGDPETEPDRPETEPDRPETEPDRPAASRSSSRAPDREKAVVHRSALAAARTRPRRGGWARPGADVPDPDRDLVPDPDRGRTEE